MCCHRYVNPIFGRTQKQGTLILRYISLLVEDAKSKCRIQVAFFRLRGFFGGGCIHSLIRSLS